MEHYMEEIAAVIFDMDGLMFDTEKVFMIGFYGNSKESQMPDLHTPVRLLLCRCLPIRGM